ncbi:MAG: LptF/LptG family permease [Phycisphaerae bacterium]|nr:YjgP/YjgQ family permease [Phycisphaerae bacterium]NIP54084.1 YjgP/YjgQ family permease [Phycisphaerae bacterium]NIS53012.1 YjgP/YjgQ family permease [Phycisphaerae bacterium]NIU10494.1 YjgP/YjgQ family permease [Phycisphaerae bacterium]NIU58282.1 LptF/LptG family permease [Phycisphaerae bacterium]
MVFTLHRYIFRELLKVFIPTSITLTLILSLGSILRPVQEYGVGPGQVVHLMGYFLPIILTFVIPMGALFATALVYGRFASDNELDACRASGICLLTLVYPGLALAIIVAIANLILSFHVVPIFVHRAESSLKANAKQILFRNIQRKGFYKLPPDGRYMIYADQANPQKDTLSGVVITKVKDNQVKAVYTAERVKIYFNPQLRFYEVQITAHNTYQIGAEGGRSISLGKFSMRMEFGSLLGDDIKFKKIDEMKKIRDVDITLFYPIEKLARQIYSRFTAESLAEDISGRFTDEPNGFYTLYSAERLVKFTAGRCSLGQEKVIELSDKIVVIEYDETGKQRLRILKCEKASLHLEGDEMAPTLTMELDNPIWQREEGTEGVAMGWLRIRGLIVPKNVRDAANQFATEDGLDAKKMAAELSNLQKGKSVKLKRLQNQLQTKIQKTLTEIEAEIHSRLVFGIGCVSLIMIGIGLGILLRDGHLLSAFGASSLPAAVLVVCIMMGKNITKNSDAQAGSGIVLMWGGMVLLSLLAIVVYRKLLKN